MLTRGLQPCRNQGETSSGRLTKRPISSDVNVSPTSTSTISSWSPLHPKHSSPPQSAATFVPRKHLWNSLTRLFEYASAACPTVSCRYLKTTSSWGPNSSFGASLHGRTPRQSALLLMRAATIFGREFCRLAGWVWWIRRSNERNIRRGCRVQPHKIFNKESTGKNQTESDDT